MALLHLSFNIYISSAMKLTSKFSNLLMLIIFTSVFNGCQLYDAAKFSYSNSISKHQWLNNTKTTHIPFTIVSELIIVPVTINGSDSLNFVFDSGAAATVILESNNTKALPLKSAGKLEIEGAGENFQSIANLVPNINVTLGDVELINQTVIHLPVSSVPFFKDSDSVFFDGVIGYDFLKRFSVKIDYDKKIISLSELENYIETEIKDDQRWERLPIDVEGNMSYVSVKANFSANQATPLRLLIDTGFSGTYEIVQAKHEKSQAPYYPTRTQGLNGDSTIHVSNTNSLSLGSYSKSNVPILYNMSTNEEVEHSELLGNQFLKHFDIIFDYRNEYLFIKPNQSFEKPINLDRSGLRFMPHKLGAMINDVAPNTAADNLGLKTGDIITRYNGKQLTPEGLSTFSSVLASNRVKVKVCWISDNTERCDDLVLASRLQPVL